MCRANVMGVTMDHAGRGGAYIGLVPFGEPDVESLDFLPAALEGIYGIPVRWGFSLPLPAAAFNRARRQYRADAFLEALSAMHQGGFLRLVGITDVDLFAPGLNFVFGQAAVGGRICVVSLARLRPSFYGEEDDEDLLRLRAIKESVHELGHTFGLEHCPHRECVMHFSNCLEDTDIKGVFPCPSCRRVLEECLRRLGTRARKP